jgi:hypothetical protein
VHPRVDVGRHDPVLHPFGGRQKCRVDLLKAPAEAGQRADVSLY